MSDVMSRLENKLNNYYRKYGMKKGPSYLILGRLESEALAKEMQTQRFWTENQDARMLPVPNKYVTPSTDLAIVCLQVESIMELGWDAEKIDAANKLLPYWSDMT